MKKTYIKPDVVFEDFSLTTNIASCEIKTGAFEGVCGVDIGGGSFAFIDGVTQCNWKPPVGSDGTVDYNGDKACYHVPIDSRNVFTS